MVFVAKRLGERETKVSKWFGCIFGIFLYSFAEHAILIYVAYTLRCTAYEYIKDIKLFIYLYY